MRQRSRPARHPASALRLLSLVLPLAAAAAAAAEPQEQPAAEPREPAAEPREQPAAEPREPAAEPREPAAEPREPAAEPQEQPAAEPQAQPAEEQCRSAYVETQRLQRAAQFRAARRSAVTCGQDQCSPTVRAHCIEWLATIERALPTLLLDVRDASGEAIAGVRVEANGELLCESWDGRALELDPGEYTLRVSSAGRAVERVTVVREGEKYHRVELHFGAGSAPQHPEAAAPARLSPPPSASPPVAAPASVPVSSYVLGGVALVGLSAFTVLGASGYVSERRLRKRCAGACPPDDVESVRLNYLLADVALGVGAASGVAALAVWLWAPDGAAEGGSGLAVGPGSVRWQGEF